MAANGKKAARLLKSWKKLKHHGACLHYVWRAYELAGAAGHANGTYQTATAGWHGSPGKHPGDRNPPAGVPVWWGPKPGSDAGDVVISLGGGKVVATDYPKYGVVGVCTIDQRERQIGRPYLGWTETILGAEINFRRGSTASAKSRKSTARGRKRWINWRWDLPTLKPVGSPLKRVKANYRVVQRYYRKWHGYTGRVDGIWGAGTEAAHQKHVAWIRHKLGTSVKERQKWLNFRFATNLKTDGIDGPKTRDAVKVAQRFYRKHYGYKGAVDGLWGDGTTTAARRHYRWVEEQGWKAPR